MRGYVHVIFEFLIRTFTNLVFVLLNIFITSCLSPPILFLSLGFVHLSFRRSIRILQRNVISAVYKEFCTIKP